MNGSDHQLPQPRLPTLLAQANGSQDRFDFRQVSLPAYLAEAPTTNLPRWIGELRSGARANVLMGVLSNRVDIKIGTARAEREIERLAEGLALQNRIEDVRSRAQGNPSSAGNRNGNGDYRFPGSGASSSTRSSRGRRT